MRPGLPIPLLAALAGCGGHLDPQVGVVLGSFGFGWNGFNHRLSYLHVLPGEDSAEVAVVGGTSTTSERTELPATCDPDACQEFPVPGRSRVDLSWSVLRSDTVALVPFTAELDATREPSSVGVNVALPEGAKGTATALLTGFTWSSDHALSGGDACYAPRLGWHPRRLMLELAEPTVEHGEASLTVSAAFEAGETHDPERACIDEVNDQAVTPMRVEGLILVGRDLAVEEQTLEDARSYPFSGDAFHPEEQEPASPVQVPLGLEATVAGTASFDWRFYPDATDEKGAYLRTFGFSADPSGSLGAWATNWSPGTQLEDFSYAVTSVARFVAVDVEAETLSASGELQTLLEADGTPVVHDLAP